jgi:hypothetical protein
MADATPTPVTPPAPPSNEDVRAAVAARTAEIKVSGRWEAAVAPWRA